MHCLEYHMRNHKNETGVSDACRVAIFKRRVHNSEDIRYNYALSMVCAADKARYCANVQPGEARVLACLEDHKDQKEFGPRCKCVLLLTGIVYLHIVPGKADCLFLLLTH